MARSQVHTPSADTPNYLGNGSVGVARAVLEELFGPPEQRAWAVRYWDGTIEAPPSAPAFTLLLRRPGALRRMLLPPSEVAIGEAYLRDDFDLEGSVEASTSLADAVADRLRSPLKLARLIRLLLQLPANDLPAGPNVEEQIAFQHGGSLHSRRRDLKAVRYHYDVGNEFYALWLDARMVYSCAYFRREDDDLDTAQKDKLEHLCRKLRLKPGERLLDIGCGWGGLVQYAAARYGVQALGITLSEPQAVLARRRIAAAGLSERCQIEVCDYRDLTPSVPFDKVVSVGMFEHVGRAQLPTYFAAAYRLTRPGGLFLNHGIAAPASEAMAPRQNWLAARVWQSGAFIQRYVFPDGELLPPHEAIRLAEHAGFETRDVESLREHYALTLRHWVRRLEARHGDAVQLVGESAYRVWRLYMSASASGFASGKLALIQALYSKPGPTGASELPLTRADLYR
ncbi:MAG TPA: cyclopropane-fatty-acyl-phospholipid synthase family protein [Ktedonobacterales bacterium]|jgi:cyclopropane-fatty-acyl-phospholipid synthase